MRQLSFRVFAITVMVVLGVAGRTATAHHAVQAEFDQNKKATITGVLTRVMWVNPHVRWMMDVKNPKTGKVEPWDISGGAPGGFRAIGITSKDVFKVGATVTAIVALARDGSNTGHVFAFILADGRKIDMWQQYSQ